MWGSSLLSKAKNKALPSYSLHRNTNSPFLLKKDEQWRTTFPTAIQ